MKMFSVNGGQAISMAKKTRKIFRFVLNIKVDSGVEKCVKALLISLSL